MHLGVRDITEHVPLYSTGGLTAQTRHSLRLCADALRQYEHVRKPETFRRWAEEAGLTVFEVTTESPGIWLTFQKELD